MAEGQGCLGHVPALPGLCFRGEDPERLLRAAPGRIADYGRWLIAEGLTDLSPETAAVAQRVETGRMDEIRVCETERRAGSAVWLSGNPAALFETDRRPLEDDAVRAHLRFTRHVVKRMAAAVAGMSPERRAHKPADVRRSLDETLVHIGNCVWWYCSRLDDALPEPPEEAGTDPLTRIERLLETASEYLLATPLPERGRIHVPRRFPTSDPEEPWTHTKVCRRQAEHVWEHLPGVTRAASQGGALTLYEWIRHEFTVERRAAFVNLLAPHLAALVQPGDRVLDLCCGAGAFSFFFEERGAAVTAIDLAPSMIQLATAAARERRSAVDFIQGDVLSHDLGTGGFHLAALLGNTLSDFPLDQFVVLSRKVAAALRPGGWFVVHYVDGLAQFASEAYPREAVQQEEPQRITRRLKEYRPEAAMVVEIYTNEATGEACEYVSYLYAPPTVRPAMEPLFELERSHALGANGFLDVFKKRAVDPARRRT